MGWLDALILGILQGLTEFLPVSSSGHLEIGKVILGVEAKESLLYTVVVHGATVLSTIVVFRKDILSLVKGWLAFRWNDETRYLVKIILSMIPVALVGVFFKDTVESFFTGNMVLVGSMLLVTATLLAFTYFSKAGNRKVGFMDSIIIGVAQALAVMPGISRSGSTIATGLLLKNDRESTARFSFLMVLVPIIGANLLDLKEGAMAGNVSLSVGALVIGFLAAFISGLLACKWMIGIVKKGKLIYFAIYCAIVGTGALLYGLF